MQKLFILKDRATGHIVNDFVFSQKVRIFDKSVAMIPFIEKYYVRKREQEAQKNSFLSDPWQYMMLPFKTALKVFREPNKSLSVDDYDGPPEYFTLWGLKLFKKPTILINHWWTYTTLDYQFRFGDLIIHRYPSATRVLYGKKYTLRTSIPETNTTSLRNYWTSVIEYQDGRGAHKGNISRTVVKLGKESMGVCFGDNDPHKLTLYDDDYQEKPAFGNSLYFIVDKSYIKKEWYDYYDFGVEQYNREESPLMI